VFWVGLNSFENRKVEIFAQSTKKIQKILPGIKIIFLFVTVFVSITYGCQQETRY
jgi:hypothetical protein